MGVFTTTMGNSTYSGFENEEAAQAFWLVSSQSDSEADEITPVSGVPLLVRAR